MIEIIRDPKEMPALADAWNELAEQFKTPLLRNEWFSACAEAYCQPGQLRVIINNSGRGIDAIAALAITKSHGLQILELLGASFLFEPSGLIYKDEEALEVLMNSIVKIGRPVVLSRLKSGSPEVSSLRKMDKKRSFCVLRDSLGSPLLPITTTWTQFESNMHSRNRYDLRRARKRSEKLGKVEFETVSPSPETLDRYLETFSRVEAAGWKGRKGTAILRDEQMKCFFSLYCRSASSLGALRLFFLRINDKPAAAMLAVEYFNRLWVLKIGYDEAFAGCSPGILLMHETIHYSFDNRLEAYEFLGNDAPWIHIWTEQQHHYVTARIYPFSISGQLGLGLDAAFAIANKALKMTVK